jgi:hypothetical protein
MNAKKDKVFQVVFSVRPESTQITINQQLVYELNSDQHQTPEINEWRFFDVDVRNEFKHSRGFLARFYVFDDSFDETEVSSLPRLEGLGCSLDAGIEDTCNSKHNQGICVPDGTCKCLPGYKGKKM